MILVLFVWQDIFDGLISPKKDTFAALRSLICSVLIPGIWGPKGIPGPKEWEWIPAWSRSRSGLRNGSKPCFSWLTFSRGVCRRFVSVSTWLKGMLVWFWFAIHWIFLDPKHTHTHVYVHIYIYIYLHTCLYIYIHILYWSVLYVVIAIQKMICGDDA